MERLKGIATKVRHTAMLVFRGFNIWKATQALR